MTLPSLNMLEILQIIEIMMLFVAAFISAIASFLKAIALP